ncbi:MAG TPA: GtrA family protein, partial [Dehalococcoidia bacterium]|nr:GtrA family protein [Dehalococcoidia bacterium]
KAISRGITMLARLVLSSLRKVRDPLSSLFLLKREVIEGVVLKPGNKILLQVLAGERGSDVREVPYIEGRWGKSALSLQEQLNCLKNILLLATEERELRRFVQFCLVGASGVGVNMGVFWLLTRVAGLSKPYDLAALILGIGAATLSNFILNEIWTFRDRRVGGITAAFWRTQKFTLVSIGAITLYYAVYTPLTRFTEIYDLVALAIAIGVGLVWNFSLNVLWTWRKK